MKLWFVRHAEAVEADEFAGDDMERPLSAAGRRSARAAFSRLAKIRRGPDVILSSEAVRARETARLLGNAFDIKFFKSTALLNPGCRFKDIHRVIAALPKKTGLAALVGHEPDFSNAVSRMTSGGHLQLVLKKGAVAELEIDGDGTAQLLMVVPPDLLGG